MANKIASKIGRPMVQVALAWIRQKEGVSAPIIGYTKSEQFEQMLSGLDLVLDLEMIDRLEAPYIPHVPVGFWSLSFNEGLLDSRMHEGLDELSLKQQECYH